MMKKITVICIIIACLLPCNIYCNATTNGKNYEKTMNVALLWKYSKGENQTIAFIDTGITKEAYEMYKERVVSPFNFIDDNSNTEDTLGHGTQVISIACGDGQKDVIGIAPKAKILPIKAIRESGSIDAKTVVKGIKYAIEKDATIINLSFGSHVEDPDVKRIIREALNKNITVIAAAGDYGQKDLLFPANMQGVISVEALNEDGQLWELSNTGEKMSQPSPAQTYLC